MLLSGIHELNICTAGLTKPLLPAVLLCDIHDKLVLRFVREGEGDDGRPLATSIQLLRQYACCGTSKASKALQAYSFCVSMRALVLVKQVKRRRGR